MGRSTKHQHLTAVGYQPRMKARVLKTDGKPMPATIADATVRDMAAVTKAGYLNQLDCFTSRIQQLETRDTELTSRLRLLEAEKLRIEQINHSWKNIFDAITDPIFLHDKEGRIVRANRAYAEQTGMDVKEIIGKSYWHLFPRLPGPLTTCTLVLTEKQETAEEEFTPDTGRTYQSRSFTLHDPTGEYSHSLHIMRDVSERKHLLEMLQKSLVDAIHAIAATLEMRDPYTAGHEKRVAQLSVAIAREMGLSAQRIEGIYFGGLIHDIGKIQVPAEILSYPGKLTRLQFEMIKTHSQAGYDILKDIEFPWPVAKMVLQHHERLDGSGYPNGLKNGDIILEARIMAVADTVEAMSSHRPYRPGLGIDKALDEISRNRGTLYDPDAVDACVRLFKEKNFSF